MKIDRSTLPKEKLALIAGLTKINEDELQEMLEISSKIPAEYIDFLREFGSGKIREPDEPQNFPAHFELLKRPKSAEIDYFRDTRIYENGAKGDILIFGLESNGRAYGFDAGDNNELVEVDSYRLVKKVNLTFCEFIFGLLACYPDFPKRCAEGYWLNDIGERFSLSAA